MTINHMICPVCGHDFYVDTAYGKCDACQCVFYASQSQTAAKRQDALKQLGAKYQPSGLFSTT